MRKIFSSLDFSFIENLIPQKSIGRKGFSPVSLFKALLLIPLGEARSQRELARKLRFDGRVCYLCGFSYGETPSHNTFTVFKKRVGEKKFKVILERLISQALSLVKENKPSAKLIYWGREKQRKRFKFRCPLFREKESCWKGEYGRSFYISESHALCEEMKIFRATKKFKKVYKKRQCVERFFSLLKEKFSLEHKLRVRGMENVRIYVYIVLSAYVAFIFARGFG